jgi:hypothetical protein
LEDESPIDEGQDDHLASVRSGIKAMVDLAASGEIMDVVPFDNSDRSSLDRLIAGEGAE